MSERSHILFESPEKIEKSLQAIAESSVYFSVATLILAILTALMLQALYDFRLRRKINKVTIENWLSMRWVKTPEQLRNFVAPSTSMKDSSEVLLANVGIFSDSPIYDLLFPQLCAQISGSLQNAVNLARAPSTLLAFAGISQAEVKNELSNPDELRESELSWVYMLVRSRKPTTEKLDRDRQILMIRTDRGVDELQSELGRVWTKSGYKWSSMIVVFLLVVLLLGATDMKASLASFFIIVVMGAGAALLAPPLQRLIGRAFHSH